MPYILIKHTVRNYEALEGVFRADAERRRLDGSKGARIFKTDGEAPDYFVLFEWDDAERARTFASSYELREATEWAGDATPPEAVIMEEILTSDA
jgi:heme-degrading monooxygenase HmoA